MRQHGASYLKIIIILIAVSVVGGYAYFRTIDLVRGGEITISHPINGATVNKSLITVEGKAKNVSTLTLNGQQIYTDESGTIHEEILLMPGYNALEVRAEDRFKREIVKRLELVYK